MLGDDLTAIDGAAAGAWIEPDLVGEPGTVSRYVPALFDSYARIFHRASDSHGRNVTWAEVARRLGRIAHSGMQWHQLVGSSDPMNFAGSKWSGADPRVGGMEIDELDRLCGVLAQHSSDPEHCFLGLCVIQSWVEDALSPEELRQPRLKLPNGRDHVVFSGPLSAVDQLGDATPPSTSWIGPDEPRVPVPREPSTLNLTEPFWREAPNLIWPGDRSWLVVSEVDFDSTLVGGPTELVEALIGTGDLEVYEVETNTSLVAFSDKFNLVPEVGD